jgi:deoxyadenosine/deoxycytidine kinase
MMNRLAVSGLVGAGKTVLSGKLAKLTGYTVIPEPLEENHFLPLFYAPGGMPLWAYRMQTFILQTRAAQQQRCYALFDRTITDRTIFEDHMFAEMHREAGNICPSDFEKYEADYQKILQDIAPPDLLIHLDVSAETALRRVKERLKREELRACEASITLEYLVSLKRSYDDFVSVVSKKIPTLVLDWENPCDTSEVVDRVAVMTPSCSVL